MDNPEQKYYQAIYDAGIENYGGSSFPSSDFSLNPNVTLQGSRHASRFNTV